MCPSQGLTLFIIPWCRNLPKRSFPAANVYTKAIQVHEIGIEEYTLHIITSNVCRSLLVPILLTFPWFQKVRTNDDILFIDKYDFPM